MGNNVDMPPNIEGVATLLVLQDQVKKLNNLNEFGYFTTNETHHLLPYHTAYLWQKVEFVNVKLLAQSGVAEMDMHAPINQWLKDAINKILHTKEAKEIHSLDFSEKLSKMENIQPNLLQEDEVFKNWPTDLPRYVLWTPFLDNGSEISGGLLLFRDTQFSEEEIKMFRWLINNYQYTWVTLVKHSSTSLNKILKDKKAIIGIYVFVIVVLAFPIRLSVVATAIVGPRDPAPINASVPGVIKEFLVKPGDSVKSGQLLVILDKKDLNNAIAINQKKVLLTEAKLRSASEQGFYKQEARSEIPVLQAELAVNQAELDYTKSLLTKTNIFSPIDGVAVFDSKEDWIGQPVQAGEDILTIADPSKTELKISVPVPDLISLELGAEGKFYLYGQLSEVPVVLISLGYNAKIMPSKVLAYQYIAKFLDPTSAPRLGSQGTVRLYGRYVPAIYYLLRRPLQALRQTLGI